MATETKAEIRKWAKERCEAWNWNADIAEIARELIDLDIATDSDAFKIIGEEFVKFFGKSDPQAKNYWDICEQIIETFG